MKIWITGASGLLGRAVRREFAAHAPAWEILVSGHSRGVGGGPRLDLLDADAVGSALRAWQPDLILHLAAERRPDVVEADPEATRRLNVEVSGRLAAWCRQAGAWLIHLSTDYVFDGSAAPYAPDAPTCPLNAYGRDKRDAEEAVRREAPDAAILRVPILYGATDDLAESAATLVAAQLLALKPGAALRLDDWSTRYPTHTGDVAVVLRQLIEHRQADPSFGGILHWSGDEPLTKYGMGCVMADALGIPRSRLEPNPSPGSGTPRPKDCHLDCSALEVLGIGRRTDFAEALRSLLKRFLPPPPGMRSAG